MSGGDNMRYETDLSDKEWNMIRHLFEPRTLTGQHLVQNSKREYINAIRYMDKTGCQWRMLPKDFPHWQSVASFFYRAKESDLWEQMNELVVEKSREKEGKEHPPTYGLIDSQSVKTTCNADNRGFDGGKKVKGHKRHIITDIHGHLLGVKVHAANESDTVAGVEILEEVLKKTVFDRNLR